MKNRSWIIIFLFVILLCAGCWLYITYPDSREEVVGIYQNGELVEKIDLSCVTGQKKITLTGKNCKNTILVSAGNIEMESADCPDRLCVKHGPLERGGTPIVCLPNKVVIKFEDDSGGADARTGG